MHVNLTLTELTNKQHADLMIWMSRTARKVSEVGSPNHVQLGVAGTYYNIKQHEVSELFSILNRGPVMGGAELHSVDEMTKRQRLGRIHLWACTRSYQVIGTDSVRQRLDNLESWLDGQYFSFRPVAGSNRERITHIERWLDHNHFGWDAS